MKRLSMKICPRVDRLSPGGGFIAIRIMARHTENIEVAEPRQNPLDFLHPGDRYNRMNR